MNPDIRKSVLRKMTYGMWLLSTGTGEDLEGSSVTWVTQVSFTPPLVTVALRGDSRLCKMVAKHKAAVLHLFASHQKNLAEAFTKPTVCGDGKIGGIAFKATAATGMPLLEGFSSWFEVKVIDTVAKGDHTVFVCEVVEVGETDPKARPLILSEVGWSYGG
jgi:flavin reductase (DIM6/NTAB) family NADH-FMN oxidoreductase RutF